MTTTTNKTMRLVKPASVKGPIDTLIDQRAKLEHALKWAEDHVQYKQDTLQAAMNRREEIKRDLALTEQIIDQHKNPKMTLMQYRAEQGTSFADRLRATGAVVADDDAL